MQAACLPLLCETKTSVDNTKTLCGGRLVENHCWRGAAVPGKTTFCVLHCTHAVYLDSPSVSPRALCPAIIQGSGCLLSIRLLSSSVHQTLILPFASSETQLFSTEAQFKLFKYSSCSPGPSERKPAGILLTSSCCPESLVGYSPWGGRVRHDWVRAHTHTSAKSPKCCLLYRVLCDQSPRPRVLTQAENLVHRDLHKRVGQSSSKKCFQFKNLPWKVMHISLGTGSPLLTNNFFHPFCFNYISNPYLLFWVEFYSFFFYLYRLEYLKKQL